MKPELTFPRRLRKLGEAFLLPLIFAAMGCQAFDRFRDPPASRDYDPLTGLPPRNDPDKRAVNITSTFNNPSNRTTPAGLAGSSSRPGDDLRIGDNRRDDRDRNLQPTGWAGTGDGKPGPNGSAELRSPVVGTSTNTPRTANPSTGPGPRIRSFEEGQQFLTARGVRWQRLETTAEGEWKFSCSIPSRPGATSMKTYEARDRFGLLAIQTVIDQIVREQQR
jgi:hypothetical protein